MDHDVDTRHVARALVMARDQVMSLSSIFPARESEVRLRVMKMLRAALLMAWPDMGSEELALLMSVDDADEYRHRDTGQFSFWWSAEVVERMADVLNDDRVPVRPKRQPKPLPADLDTTGLPLCGPRRPGTVPVVRRAVVARQPRPTRVAKPWDPIEARQPVAPAPRRAIPLGEPAYERSALYERRMAAASAEARA